MKDSHLVFAKLAKLAKLAKTKQKAM